MSDHYLHSIVDTDRKTAGKVVNDSPFLRPTDTVSYLKSFLWQEFELSRAAFGFVPATLAYESKLKLGYFGYYHNRHTQFLHERVKELPGGLGDSCTPALIRDAFERISAAPSSHAFLAGYRYVYRKLLEAYDHFMSIADPVLDAPTFAQLRLALLDRQEILSWLDETLRFAGLDEQERQWTAAWETYVAAVWETFRQAGSGAPVAYPEPPDLEPAGPIPAKALIDESRFPIHIPSGKSKQSYSDEDISPLFHSVRQMVYINATEIGAAETMAYFYYSVQNMPLEFYYDIARHMWDEFRHSEMGMRRLKQYGYHTTDFKWLRSSSISDDVESRYADMYANLTMVAEACSFGKKRKAVEAFWQHGDALAAVQTEFDIVDERLHVDFGTKWGPELYKQVGDMITPKVMAERARQRRLEQFQNVQPDELERLARNFPAFCGLHTNTLAYESY